MCWDKKVLHSFDEIRFWIKHNFFHSKKWAKQMFMEDLFLDLTSPTASQFKLADRSIFVLYTKALYSTTMSENFG